MNTKQLRRFIMTALFAAMILLTTAYVLHIPVGTGGGYIHLGDTVIYLAAALLPTPFAALSAALGGALADVLTGAAMWAPATAIIKSVMVIPFTCKKSTLICRRNLLAPLFSGIIGIAGYFVAEIVIVTLSGSEFTAAVAGSALAVLPNVLQETGGAVAFYLIAFALDRMHFKSRLSQLL